MSSTPERWRSIEELYLAAIERAPDQRAAFLRESCPDEEVRREVESLLRFEGTGDTFMRHSPWSQSSGLEPGVRLGPYEIESRLGAGGMGEVWKARDTRLGRSVALKVSKTEFSERFEREARAVAALNHPNIATLFDVGPNYFVMEYVDGRLLQEVIPIRGLSVGELLKYAVQIADALATAHAAGIVHRDLKPGNVMITSSGRVKVVDFGLARVDVAQKPDGAVFQQTAEGIIAGTVAYMSPEQAEGRNVDARSDIFAFGALLFEMATGRRAFEGGSKLATLSAILRENTRAPSELATAIPSDLDRIVLRCLRKDPACRFQSMSDLKISLEDLKGESASGMFRPETASRKPLVKHMRLLLTAALVLLLALMGLTLWRMRESATPTAPFQPVPLTSFAGREVSPSFSPDGNQVGFSWNGDMQDNYDIYVKLIGFGPPVRLTTDRGADTYPKWSPDGRWIAFVRSEGSDDPYVNIGFKSEVLLVPALGGPEQLVAEFPEGAIPDGWSPDGRWLVIERQNSATKRWAVSLVSTEAGEKRQITDPPAGAWDLGAALAPDGHTLVFARWTSDTVSDLYALALEGNNFEPKGEPRRLTFDHRPIHGIAWTPDGREIVFHSDRGGPGGLWRLDVSGHAQPQRLPFGESGRNPAISSNGKRLVYSQSLSNSNIWRVNLREPREEPVPFIFSTRSQSAPRYSPEGAKIAFISNRSGNDQVWMCDADGSHAIQLTSVGPCGHTSWSPDGQRIVFGSDIDGYTQIFAVNVHGARTQRISAEPHTDTGPNWSNDGGWIFFTSDRNGGDFQLWKMAVGGGQMTQLTKRGGWANLPSPDGKYVYYKNKHSAEGELWRVPVDGGEESRVLDSVSLMNFDVTLGGIYFLSGTELRYYNFRTRKFKLLRNIRKPADRGLVVSPDEHWLLYTQIDQIGDDLMLVENFR